MPDDPNRATIAAELTHNALLRVSGDDAAAFLHGQFTNDVELLPVDAAQWSSWLTAKGRMLASFLLVRRADHFLLMLPAEIVEPVAKRLRMFVLRSKVKIEDVTSANVRFGVAGSVARPAIASLFGGVPEPMRVTVREEAVCVGLEAERFVVFAPLAIVDRMREALAGANVSGPEAWEAGNIRAGVPTIVAATQEAFIPQMVNYELIGGVSFKKGCYPGQEIVARMHYRGGLKRRMALAHFAAGEAPKPGDALFSRSFGEQAAGEVANVAAVPEGGFDALVVAQLDSLASNDLHWKSLDGPALQLKPLPYDIPNK